MIVVRLEMWPQGDRKRAYELGRTYIWNQGQCADPKRGDYGVAVRKKGCEDLRPGEQPHDRATRTGEVLNSPRLSYNVWRLIARALKAAFPEEAQS